MNSTLEAKRSDTLDAFSVWYSQWHGYVSLIICAVGIPLNVINIIVLTRKKMQTPINCILTWLALADMVTMASYVPFAYHFYCHFPSYSRLSAEKNSSGWMNYLLVHLNLSATAHTVSIWLAVTLAVLRHHHINSPAKGGLTRMRRLIRARLLILIVFSVSVVLMIPSYLSHSLEEIRFHDNSTGYIFEDWALGSRHVKPIKLIALITYSLLAKLVPCVLIIIYGGMLLRTLNITMRNRRRMSSNGVIAGLHGNHDRSRTTVMLLVVIVLFLLTELPQGILIMCCVFIKDFFENIYIPLGDTMDIIALINNSINFVLYCTMSQEFRRTFINLFCTFSLPKILHRKPYVSTQTNDDRGQMSA
ncbi:G-protein coupled receptor [Mactra antiquata]